MTTGTIVYEGDRDSIEESTAQFPAIFVQFADNDPQPIYGQTTYTVDYYFYENANQQQPSDHQRDTVTAWNRVEAGTIARTRAGDWWPTGSVNESVTERSYRNGSFQKDTSDNVPVSVPTEEPDHAQ